MSEQVEREWLEWIVAMRQKEGSGSSGSAYRLELQNKEDELRQRLRGEHEEP